MRLNRALTLMLLGLASTLEAAEDHLLWQIGKPDNQNGEFALAPNRYGEFREDGFFAIGQSDPKTDWPYAHPGPHDSWAGGRPHTFAIVFGLQRLPAEGECQLLVDFLDTHSRSAPRLRISLNGREFMRQVPPGAGDDSIYGQPAKGKAYQLKLTFPSTLLRTGANEVAITTVEGAWVLYDWVGLETPPGAELTSPQGTLVSSVRTSPVLVERDGQLAQTIDVAIRHLGEPRTAIVRVDGKKAAEVQLQRALTSAEVPVPAVAKPQKAKVEVVVDGKVLAEQEIELKPVRKWVVYLLPHSHVDIGYTHVQTDVERAQWKYLEMAMETAKRTAGNPAGSRFKWNVEVLWAVDSYLKQASPEKQQQFIDAVRAGQVGLQALYGNELTGLCRPEELLRLMSYAQKLSQRCGVPIQSAMITDVPGYTWGMVPAFTHAGVKYFSIGPNGGDRIGHTIAAWGDKPFWWVGPNQRDKTLVWMTGTGYYQVYSSPQKLMEYLGRLDEKGYPFDYVQVRHCLGDNGAPDVNFADKVKAWNDTHAYPRLVIATSEEMFRDFEQRYGDQIPTARGDFTPYWEDGAASSARETALNRATADRLVQAEALFAMLNPNAYSAEAFYQAWRNTILYDEHTWGAHNSISQPDHPFVKSQWAIKQQFALDADKHSRELLAAAVASAGEADPEGNAVDVIHTGHFLTHALVTIPAELSKAGDCVSTVRDSKSEFCTQRLTTGELVFRPCIGGFVNQRFYISNGKAGGLPKGSAAEAEGNVLRTALLTLRLDEKTGAIASLAYKRVADELVNAKGPCRLNDYVYLPGSDVKGAQKNGPVKISVKEKGPLVASLLVESDAPGCNKLSREVRVHALRNYVEIIDTVDKKAVRAKEGVHFGFAFNVPDGQVRMDVPWAVVRPETDQIPGACKNWFTVQRWVDISNDKYGVTWLTPDAPLVQVGGMTANLIGSLPDPRVWMDHIEPSQTIYSWAMNNHWHTNYRAEQEGPTVFRYYIFPHSGRFRQEEAAGLGVEIGQPVVVVPARKAERVNSALWLSNRKVQLTALKPSEDGKAIILRFFGAAGEDAEARIEWRSIKPKSVWQSDLSERPGEKAGETIRVPAYGLVTLRAEL